MVEMRLNVSIPLIIKEMKISWRMSRSRKRLWISTFSHGDGFANIFSRIMLSIHYKTFSKALKEFFKQHPNSVYVWQKKHVLWAFLQILDVNKQGSYSDLSTIYPALIMGPNTA